MTEATKPLHDPVMVPRILELLEPALGSGGVLIDATLGMGGHSEAALRAFPQSSVIGFDRDPAAIKLATARLEPFGPRFSAVQSVFDDFPLYLSAAESPLAAGSLSDDRNADHPRAFLFDLGVSSLQIDSDSRGFAYSRDTHLDMRMNPADSLTAEEVVNDYGVEELSRVIRQYGEERHSRRFAAAIDRARQSARITSTGQLAAIVEQAAPAAQRRKGHPAKRVFQAIRIEVNDELGSLQRAIEAAVAAVGVGGRIVVLSYHSLEDRIVKRCFASGVNPPVPPGLPIIPPDRQPWLGAVTRGSEGPSEAEAEENPRSRSARLRVVSKLRAWPVERVAVS